MHIYVYFKISSGAFICCMALSVCARNKLTVIRRPQSKGLPTLSSRVLDCCLSSKVFCEINTFGICVDCVGRPKLF